MQAKESFPKKKHITLYFDVNDTMWMGDSAKGVDKKTAILKMLAERYVAVWDPNITTEPMSYKRFVEEHLCPGNRRDEKIQQAQINHYNGFFTFLESKHPTLIQLIKDDYLTIQENLAAGYIPQSFIKLIDYLEQNNDEYSLVFRTFGNDIKAVIDELRERTSINVQSHAVFESGNLTLPDGRVLTTPAEILAHFKSSKYIACRDNFVDWRNTGEKYTGGKPHIIDFHSDDITMFCDDNALKKEILCVKSSDGDYFDQRLIQDVLISLGRIVPVDPYLVCTDSDYFINKIKFSCQTPLQLSHYLPLSENGASTLDEAIFCWAIRQLNPNATMQIARNCFGDMSEAYNDSERYFHRGLGHPRSLLPPISQFIYKSALAKNDKLNLQSLIDQFHEEFLIKLPQLSERNREAQEIIAGFYHDVVHRRGKKPNKIEKYRRDDHYSPDEMTTPVTCSLLDTNKLVKPEELSCLVVEDALNEILPKKSLLPIVLAILSTIPFSDISLPENLTRRVIKSLETNTLSLSCDEIYAAVNVAVAVTNRDHASYAEDSLDEFNKKTWAMMFERNSNLASPDYRLQDEAETIATFYEFHKKLYHDMMSGMTHIYHSQDNTLEAIALNHKAKETLRLDILLQGVQLAALAIRMAALTNNSDIMVFLQKYEASSRVSYLHELPNDVLNVLKGQGKECVVNGITMIRGTSNGDFALRMVNLLSLEKMLEVADNYKNFTTINDVRALFKPLAEQSVKVSQFDKNLSFLSPAIDKNSRVNDDCELQKTWFK